MKRTALICLSLIVLFVGTQASQLNSNHNTQDLPQKLELLQTKATTEVETAATATASTATGTDTDCEPECLYKFPYLDSECEEEKPPGPPTPPNEPPKTFIEEAKGCYYFNLTVEEPPKEDNKTFVEEVRACYNFTSGTETDESCDEPSKIYRYPFENPGKDCEITFNHTEEEQHFIQTEGDYEDHLPNQEIITVAEDGETTIYTIYEGEEIIEFPGGNTTIIIHEDNEDFVHTYDESGEEIVPIPPAEEVTIEEGNYTAPPPTGNEDHGEELVIIFEECYQFTETDDGETIIVNEEFGYYTEEIPPQVTIEINEDGEMIVVTETDGSYTEEIPPGEPTFDIESGEGVTETISTSGEVIADLEGEIKVIINEGDEQEDTYSTSGEVIVDLEGEIKVVITEGEEEEDTYSTSGEVIVDLEGEIKVVIDEGDEQEDTYSTSGEVIVDLEGEIKVIINEEHEEEETYSTSGEWSIPIPYDGVIISEDHGEGSEECIIIRDTYTSGTYIIYGQPTTYITYNTYDYSNYHSVSYTYVLTNIYSGIFKTSKYEFVIYGAGAVNFYNTYYGIDARIHDKPSCSCTCGYQTYTFSYTFGF